MHRVRAVQIYVTLDHLHLGHLALELCVVPFEVVTHSVRFEFVCIEDAPYGGFARLRQPVKSRFGGVGSHILSQRRGCPQLSGQSKILGLPQARSTTDTLAGSLICGALAR